MEKDINIAEILKDMPIGTKLYSPICGECEFKGLGPDFTGKCIAMKKEEDTQRFLFSFYSDGRFSETGECLLFPSKSMKDWSKITWKKGDVLVSKDGRVEVIFDHFTNDYYTFVGKYTLLTDDDGCTYVTNESTYMTASYFIEDKDAAQCYINTVEERFDGKLNKETLEMESKLKCPFKPYDKVLVRDASNSIWKCDLFSHMQDGEYACVSFVRRYCIPYEGNEHLLGTNNPEE